MMEITLGTWQRYKRLTSWIDCEIVNHKVRNGWSLDRIEAFLRKNINNEDGYDWTYGEALELRDLLLSSNNHRI